MRSITWKLVVSYVGVIALSLLIVSVWISISVGQRFEAFVENTLTRQGESLAARIAQRSRAGNDWPSNSSLITTSAGLTRSDIWIFDANGQVQLSAMAEGAPRDAQPAPSEIAPALQGGTAHGGRGMLLFGSRQVYAVVPIKSGGRVIGAVYLVQSPPLTPRRRDIDDFLPAVNDRIVGGGIVAGMLAIVIGVALARSITKPIREITTAVEKIARGDYGQRVSVRSRDEVGQLAAACNQMAERLEHDVGELKRQEQLRRDLVANVSHDLSTPLTSIQGFTEALLDGVVKGEGQRQETFQTIYTEVLRLHRLVDDLKGLGQLEQGMIRIAPQPLHLSPFVQEIIRVEQAEAEGCKVSLVQTVPEEIPPVLADGDRVGQALLNLIDNALRYTPEGGIVTVSAEAIDDVVWIAVSDTGDGIPSEDMPFIFERFYRVDPSRSKITGGGGLGLAIVKAIVEAHGGMVEAKSTIGGGTTIRFSLPVVVTARPSAETMNHQKVPVA